MSRSKVRRLIIWFIQAPVVYSARAELALSHITLSCQSFMQSVFRHGFQERWPSINVVLQGDCTLLAIHDSMLNSQAPGHRRREPVEILC